MWKYLAFNSFWFSILFLAQFMLSKTRRVLVFWIIIMLGILVAAQSALDPFGWFLYFIFSLLTFWSARQFRRWVFAKSMVLDEEIRLSSKEIESKRARLNEKMREAEALGQKTNEIMHLYDKVKEMSQSLDMLETFLVFGEALSNHFQFSVIKLALFDEENAQAQHPDQVYELRRTDFEGIFDRSLFLKDRKKAKTHLFPFDQRICEMVFKNQKACQAVSASSGSSDETIRLWPDFLPFIAEPIFIHRKIFAVLIILGASEKDLAMLSILTERFIAEAQRVKLYEKVETLAITDGLTGMYVRRHLVERLEGEADRSKRFGFKLSFLMVDIDNFKRFNDEYGHLVGDVVLRQVSETIKKNVREIDLVGRYGGEEFGVLLVETDESGAFFVAERIRRAVEEKSFTAYDENLKVTISVGSSTYSKTLSDVSLIVDAADSALYQAKRQGRNRVCLAQMPS